MGLTYIPGPGLMIPPFPRMQSATPNLTAIAASASTDKVAMCGHFFHKDRIAKAVNKVWFVPSAITSAGGSTGRVSLQDVNLAAGPPAQPDEVVDQSATFLLSSLSSGNWNQSAALSANRTITPGELIAVVFDYSAYAGADAYSINGWSGNFANDPLFPTSSRKNAGSYAANIALPNVILECTDGTFGGIDGAVPGNAVISLAYNSGTVAQDEVALRFKLPFNAILDGCWAIVSIAGTTSNFDIVLYDGTTAIRTVSIDGNILPATARVGTFGIPPTPLVAGRTYYLSFKPTTANNITLVNTSVSANAHYQSGFGGSEFYYSSRVDAGAWAETNTKFPWIGIRLAAVDQQDVRRFAKGYR